MSSRTLSQITFATLMGFVLSGLLGVLVVAYSVIQTDQRAHENLARSTHFAPRPNDVLDGVPSPTQSSIDRAIAFYQIKVPSNVKGPGVDMTLTDRGLTTRRGALSKINVTIGPDAFSSWAMLASTISHEVEVHCRQNFFAIHLMDMAGMDGTGQAEREAYAHELNSAARFGLSPYDQDLIRSTSDYYYPEKRNQFASQIVPLKMWIDRVATINAKKRL